MPRRRRSRSTCRLRRRPRSRTRSSPRRSRRVRRSTQVIRPCTSRCRRGGLPPLATADPNEGCDEVSCVLDKYARPCCEHFRPAEGGSHGGTPDTLDRVMVHAGVQSVMPRVIACGEKIAAKGTVKIAMKVGADGKVREVSVAEAPVAGLWRLRGRRAACRDVRQERQRRVVHVPVRVLALEASRVERVGVGWPCAVFDDEPQSRARGERAHLIGIPRYA